MVSTCCIVINLVCRPQPVSGGCSWHTEIVGLSLTGVFPSVLEWRTAASGHPTIVVDQKRPQYGSKMTHSGSRCVTSLSTAGPRGCDSTGPHDAQSLTELEGRASPVWGQHRHVRRRRVDVVDASRRMKSARSNDI